MINKNRTSNQVFPLTVGFSFFHKTLFAGNIPQSGGEFHAMWKKSIAYIYIHGFRVNTCLALGVAGATNVVELKKYYPDAFVTGIEKDQNMITLAKKHFHIDRITKFTLIEADAFAWITTCRTNFDLIIIDLFIGDLNPARTRSKTFLMKNKKLLTSHGAIIYNCHFRKNNEKEFQTFVSLSQQLFRRVTVLYSFPKNRVLLLTDANY